MEWLVKNWERNTTRLCVFTLLIQFICRVYLVKCWAGWIKSWNQDCQEKYQQSQICRWYHSKGTKWRRTKEPLGEGERESENAGLKLNLQKTKITECDPITSWQIKGGKVEAMTDFILSNSKITTAGECNHEIKRHLLLGKKAMTNLDSNIKKQRTHFANKGPYSQSYGFSCSHVQLWELDHK